MLKVMLRKVTMHRVTMVQMLIRVSVKVYRRMLMPINVTCAGKVMAPAKSFRSKLKTINATYARKVAKLMKQRQRLCTLRGLQIILQGNTSYSRLPITDLSQLVVVDEGIALRVAPPLLREHRVIKNEVDKDYTQVNNKTNY